MLIHEYRAAACDGFQAHSCYLWVGNQAKTKAMKLRKPKTSCRPSGFVSCVCVQAIPTYRVYQLKSGAIILALQWRI